MAFPPNQTSGRGDVNSVARVVWNDVNSEYVAVQGGKQYAGSGYGDSDYNWDDAEGWAPRINFHGTSDQKPWNGIGGGSGEIDHKSKSGMASLRRKNENTYTSTTGTSAYILQLKNKDGAAGNEVYTDNYQPSDDSYTVCKTPDDATWYVSWYARKSSGEPSNSVTVRMTLYVFGVGWTGSSWTYAFTGAVVANGSNGTVASPATGGSTYYIGKKTLTTTWTKYEGCFTLNGDSDIERITMRWDIDDGDPEGGDTKIYIDRPILYPVGIKYRGSGADGGSDPDSVGDGDEGSYAAGGGGNGA